MDRDLIDLLNLQVTINPCTDVNEYEEPVYGSAPIVLPCYVDSTIRMIYNKEGLLVTSTAQVYLNNTYIDGDGNTQPVTIGERDQITLPNGKQPLILGILPSYDEQGNLYAWEIDT